MTSPGDAPPQQARRESGSAPGRRLGICSVVALAAFVPWTAAFIAASAALAQSRGLDPDQPFGSTIEGAEWLGWAAAAVIWVLPLLVAAVLGSLGLRRGGGTSARIGAYLGAGLALLLLVLTGLQALLA
jgi:hypothetical protein